MDRIAELASSTVAALMRDYFLWIGILSLVLAFALYIYFFPTSVDFFANPEPNIFQQTGLKDKRLRSEPADDDIHSHNEPEITDRPAQA